MNKPPKHRDIRLSFWGLEVRCEAGYGQTLVLIATCRRRQQDRTEPISDGGGIRCSKA